MTATKTYLIGNSYNGTKQEIIVNEEKQTVRTNNQKIRKLIKDFLNGKYINQGECFCAVDYKNNYCIFPTY